MESAIMKLSDFNFELPPELIATHPAQRRDESRLLVVRRGSNEFEHRHFADLAGLLRPGDCLVINNSKVLPARLHCQRPGGGETELLLLAEKEKNVWEAMVRPARKLRPGLRLQLPGGEGWAEILEGEAEGESERTRRVRFEIAGEVLDFLERQGEMPLPPYILHQRKAQGETPRAVQEDRARYQTVYASPAGSVAAPTAGLHFTPDLLEQLKAKGVEIQQVTLHVGMGTFEPITVNDPKDHVMHYEHYVIGREAAQAIEAARLDPQRRIVAVGTTSVRTLESCFARHGCIQEASESTNLFIYPGYSFGVVQAMVTNFHLPGSTLILLVAALAGRERILSAYQEAIAKRYRFYSYGDAMFIE
jgi:S-adenosylmethionine:tRNA ribosyltransferase-isomerase